MRAVRSLNLILMLLGGLSVLLLGAVPASATAGDAAPCHEAVATPQSHHEAPDSPAEPEKPMTAMACCVSCVVAPALQPPERDMAFHPGAPAVSVPAALPVGLSPTPEHGPPKA
ncbi:hypothetical protein [Brevundimonas sp.]|uniref:hypothetical protein n=1 Tax=Brevundimonas sp. TaxID=1871086 RepID=UPI002FC6C539